MCHPFANSLLLARPTDMKKVFTFLLSFIALSVSAQNRLEAKMDSTSMLIGSQVNLELVVHTKSAAQPTFPTYNEASPIAEGVEVLASSEIEQTEGSSDGEKVWRKKYSLTSFDVGTHQFSPCVLLGNDSLQCSQPLTLKVRALVLDTAQNVQMRGAAGVESVPFAVNYRLLIGGIIL